MLCIRGVRIDGCLGWRAVILVVTVVFLATVCSVQAERTADETVQEYHGAESDDRVSQSLSRQKRGGFTRINPSFRWMGLGKRTVVQPMRYHHFWGVASDDSVPEDDVSNFAPSDQYGGGGDRYHMNAYNPDALDKKALRLFIRSHGSRGRGRGPLVDPSWAWAGLGR